LAESFDKFLEPVMTVSRTMEQPNCHNILQLMTIFQFAQVKSIEAWKKAEFLLSAVYKTSQEQV